MSGRVLVVDDEVEVAPDDACPRISVAMANGASKLLRLAWCPGTRETRGTQASSGFGPKSAPRHRDFGPGRKILIKKSGLAVGER